MRRISFITVVLSLIMNIPLGYAAKRYGEQLCNLQDYFCIKVSHNESWQSLFPDPEQRDIVRRVNRMNIRLRPGFVIAIPKNIEKLKHLSFLLNF